MDLAAQRQDWELCFALLRRGIKCSALALMILDCAANKYSCSHPKGQITVIDVFRVINAYSESEIVLQPFTRKQFSAFKHEFMSNECLSDLTVNQMQSATYFISNIMMQKKERQQQLHCSIK